MDLSDPGSSLMISIDPNFAPETGLFFIPIEIADDQ